MSKTAHFHLQSDLAWLQSSAESKRKLATVIEKAYEEDPQTTLDAFRAIILPTPVPQRRRKLTNTVR